MFRNNIHFISFFIILLVLSFYYKIFIFILLGYSIYIFIKNKRFFYWILFIGIIFSGVYYYSLNKNIKNNNVLDNELINIEIIEKKKNYYLVKIKKKEKAIFYSNNEYDIGNIVIGYYKEEVIRSNGVDLIFNYKDYLKKQGINKIFSLKEEKLINNKKSFFNIRYEIEKYFKKKYDIKTKEYLTTLLLGINDIDEEIYDNYLNFNITHLLAISGLHINIMILILGFLLKKIKFKEKVINIILILYLFILNFIPSVFRAISIYIFKNKFKLSTLDSWSFSLIFFLFLFPGSFFLPSFYLSYLIALFLSLAVNNKNKIYSIFMINIFIFPFIINLNNSYNLLSLFIGFLSIYFYSYLVIPFSFIILVLPSLSLIYNKLIMIFEKILELFSKINFTNIIFSNFSLSLFLIYYLFLYFHFSFNKKKYLFFIFILIIGNNIGYYSNKNIVYMLDVGQGDSTVYINKFNKCNMVFDSYYNTYEYLTKRGIKRIDYLIYSHSHNDHIYNYEKIISNLNVKNILVSKYDDSSEITNLLNNNNKNNNNLNIKKVSAGDELYCGNAYIKFLSPEKKYNNLNDNSLVFQLYIENKTFLFTGDISSEVEKDLIKKYQNNLKSDILKIAHHGSSTSSSLEFLKKVQPKIAFISSGVNNIYGFPDIEVIKRLEEMNVLNIHITARKKSLKIKI